MTYLPKAYYDALYAEKAHKTTEDAITGIVKVDGAGNYTAVTDNSSNWDAASIGINLNTPKPVAVDGSQGWYMVDTDYNVFEIDVDYEQSPSDDVLVALPDPYEEGNETPSGRAFTFKKMFDLPLTMIISGGLIPIEGSLDGNMTLTEKHSCVTLMWSLDVGWLIM